MFDNDRNIDINRLREDMEDESLGAFFGGGFGGALFEAFDISNATEAELIRMAQQEGIDLRKYQSR